MSASQRNLKRDNPRRAKHEAYLRLLRNLIDRRNRRAAQREAANAA